MLSGAIPLFAFVCAWALLRAERPTSRMIAGVVCGFVGVLMIARPWSAVGNVNLAGVGYMVAGSLSVGCSFVYARRFLSKLDMSPVALSAWQIGFALLTIACITPFHGMTHIASSARRDGHRAGARAARHRRRVHPVLLHRAAARRDRGFEWHVHSARRRARHWRAVRARTGSSARPACDGLYSRRGVSAAKRAQAGQAGTWRIASPTRTARSMTRVTFRSTCAAGCDNSPPAFDARPRRHSMH